MSKNSAISFFSSTIAETVTQSIVFDNPREYGRCIGLVTEDVIKTLRLLEKSGVEFPAELLEQLTQRLDDEVRQNMGLPIHEGEV